MPRTKREGVFYGVVMAFTMSIFMNLLNTFLHAGVSMQSLIHRGQIKALLANANIYF